MPGHKALKELNDVFMNNFVNTVSSETTADSNKENIKCSIDEENKCNAEYK